MLEEELSCNKHVVRTQVDWKPLSQGDVSSGVSVKLSALHCTFTKVSVYAGPTSSSSASQTSSIKKEVPVFDPKTKTLVFFIYFVLNLNLYIYNCIIIFKKIFLK